MQSRRVGPHGVAGRDTRGRNAAGPEQAPALLAAVLKIQNANERREAGLTWRR